MTDQRTCTRMRLLSRSSTELERNCRQLVDLASKSHRRESDRHAETNDRHPADHQDAGRDRQGDPQAEAVQACVLKPLRTVCGKRLSVEGRQPCHAISKLRTQSEEGLPMTTKTADARAEREESLREQSYETLELFASRLAAERQNAVDDDHAVPIGIVISAGVEHFPAAREREQRGILVLAVGFVSDLNQQRDMQALVDMVVKQVSNG